MPNMTQAQMVTEIKRLSKHAEELLGERLAAKDNPDAWGGEKETELEQTIEEAKGLKAQLAQVRALSEIAVGLDEALTDAADEAKATKPQRGRSNPTGLQFKDWGEFLVSTWASGNPNVGWVDPRLLKFKDPDEQDDLDRLTKGLVLPPEAMKQLVENTGSAGGFLVPIEFLTNLYAVMGETAIVRPRASIIRMRRRQVQIPVLDQTDTTAGVFPWFGGMQFYWESEATEKTLTTAEFRQVTLTAYKLIGYTRASDELLDDAAISLNDFLAGPVGLAGGISAQEDYAFLRGTGVGQPLGVLNAPVTLAQNRNAANQVDYKDFARMMEKFIPSAAGAWVITQSLMSEVIELAGPSGNPSYVWQPSAREGIPGYIFGYPVIWSEKLPAKGTKGDVLLADFSYYLLGDRQATTVETTGFDYWRFDLTSWRAVHRVGGRPWLSAPITYVDGATQISPFVVLDSTVGS